MKMNLCMYLCMHLCMYRAHYKLWKATRLDALPKNCILALVVIHAWVGQLGNCVSTHLRLHTTLMMAVGCGDMISDQVEECSTFHVCLIRLRSGSCAHDCLFELRLALYMLWAHTVQPEVTQTHRLFSLPFCCHFLCFPIMQCCCISHFHTIESSLMSLWRGGGLWLTGARHCYFKTNYIPWRSIDESIDNTIAI